MQERRSGKRFGRGMGAAANRVVGEATGRIDAGTTEVAARAARVIVVAVRLLRWPTLAVLAVPVPFVVATLALAASADGWFRVVGLVAGGVMALVSIAFGARRHKILRAVDDPQALGTELGIAVSLSDRADETRGALERIAGGGGWRVLSRLRGVWGGVRMTGRWIDEVGDLPRARYFVPPKIGTTVSVTIAALWLVPLSIVVTLFVVIGRVAGSL